MVCTEAMLLSCRDIVAWRVNLLKNGQTLDAETEEWHMQILNNTKITWMPDYWSPIALADQEWQDAMQSMESMGGLWTCMKDQVLEREEELVEFAAWADTDERKDKLFAGMPKLVQSWANKHASDMKAASSAEDAQVKKAK